MQLLQVQVHLDHFDDGSDLEYPHGSDQELQRLMIQKKRLQRQCQLQLQSVACFHGTGLRRVFLVPLADLSIQFEILPSNLWQMIRTLMQQTR